MYIFLNNRILLNLKLKSTGSHEVLVDVSESDWQKSSKSLKIEKNLLFEKKNWKMVFAYVSEHFSSYCTQKIIV